MLVRDLYPYQEKDVDNVLALGYGLIAYEQGLGKSTMSVAIVEELLAKPEINFCLLVVPASLKDQWANTISVCTDVTSYEKKVKDEVLLIPDEQWCVIIEGDKKKRLKQYEYIAENWPNYVIVSYETLRVDYDYIEKLKPECIICDEISALKGFKAKISKLLKKLGKEADITIGLTGTPVENRLEELYSIMEFVEPGYLGTFASFDAKYIVRDMYGRVVRYKNLDILHEKLSKVMFRKTKTDPEVAPYLPTVDYKTEFVFLSPKIQRVYNYIAQLALEDMSQIKKHKKFDLSTFYAGGGGDVEAQGKLMAKLGALQMLCNDTRLLIKSAENYLNPEIKSGSEFAAELMQSGWLEGLDSEKSAKLEYLKKYVPNLLEVNQMNKLIIFSFYKDMGKFVQETFPQYDSVLYNGDMSSSQKSAAKARFQNNPDCRLFIASDAGAYGVDLPQANYLINLDFVYSAGKMSQRNSRHVRAGSKHDHVSVVNILADGTVDELKESIFNFKSSIAEGVVDGNGLKKGGELENDVEKLSEFLSSQLSLAHVLDTE